MVIFSDLRSSNIVIKFYGLTFFPSVIIGIPFFFNYFSIEFSDYKGIHTNKAYFQRSTSDTKDLTSDHPLVPHPSPPLSPSLHSTVHFPSALHSRSFRSLLCPQTTQTTNDSGKCTSRPNNTRLYSHSLVSCQMVLSWLS